MVLFGHYLACDRLILLSDGVSQASPAGTNHTCVIDLVWLEAGLRETWLRVNSIIDNTSRSIFPGVLISREDCVSLVGSCTIDTLQSS